MRAHFHHFSKQVRRQSSGGESVQLHGDTIFNHPHIFILTIIMGIIYNTILIAIIYITITIPILYITRLIIR